MENIDKKEQLKIKHYESSNKQSCLIGLMIALLNQTNEIIIGKSQKISTKTIPLIKVISIKNNSFDFQIQQFIKKRNIERINEQNKLQITMKTAKRRGQAFKRRENMHILEDILFENNYVINIEKEDRDGIRGNVCIFYDHTLIYTLNEIMNKGKIICEYIINKLGKNKQINIYKNELKQFLTV